jgi:hypothetical protein
LVVHYRRTLIVLLVAIVVISLSGCCGNVPVTPTGDTSTPKPTVTTTAGKIAVPAQEWYAKARAEAEGWNSDVFLYNIGGTNKESGILPVDGKCREWSYDFISPSAKTLHTVIIRDGAVSSTDNTVLGNDATWAKIMSNTNFRINSWALDSPAATIKANEQYRKLKGSDPSVQVMYTLLQDVISQDKCQLTWIITYDPSARLTNPSAPITVIKVDANTGSIIG